MLLKIYCNRRKAPAARIFYTGCASYRKNRPIDFFEASCGACAPRCPRKHGQSVRAPRLRTLRHRHSQARRRWNRQYFSPQLAQRVLQKTRLHRSKLANLIHVLQTHFNYHYFTLTGYSEWRVRRSSISGREIIFISCWL